MNEPAVAMGAAAVLAVLGIVGLLAKRGGVRLTGALLLVASVVVLGWKVDMVRTRGQDAVQWLEQQWYARQGVGGSIVASVLLALGMWQLLPRGVERGRRLGFFLTLLGLAAFTSQLPALFGAFNQVSFGSIATLTIVSAVCAVTFRNPVYCAIWFAITLLGVSGLFLLQGAQFLAVATLVVYAGAILVMFLFVLMLAQTKGRAAYDRLSWEAFLSSATGAVMVGLLTWALNSTLVSGVAETPPATEEQVRQELLNPTHMVRLGRELFSKNLVAIELAATLLMIALVGAIAMVAHDKHTHDVEARNAPPRLASADKPASSSSRSTEPARQEANRA